MGPNFGHITTVNVWERMGRKPHALFLHFEHCYLVCKTNAKAGSKMAARFTEEVVLKVGAVLNDKSQPLSKRFRALFTLRNIGGEAAIKEISKCFVDPSSLLKHELA